MIQFQNVSREYAGGNVALDNVSLSIASGELVFLSGPSGAGKSTLLKLISAMEKPTKGCITVGGQEINNIKRVMIPFLRQNLGLVLQQNSLLTDRNLLANVMLPMQALGISGQEAKTRALAALDKVGLKNHAQAMPQSVSGGEQQRAEIARAIVNRPQIILADEPTTNLDRDSASLVMRALVGFKEAGVTCVVSTHDDYFLHQATRVLYLRDGKLINDRTVKPVRQA